MSDDALLAGLPEEQRLRAWCLWLAAGLDDSRPLPEVLARAAAFHRYIQDGPAGDNVIEIKGKR